MKKKVLILGSTGMLGHQVYFRFKKAPEYEVFDISFRNKLSENTIICDITDFKLLSSKIDEIVPDIIINCVGILIKESNQNPKNSILINAFFPHWLVSEADLINAKVIHISTDCVFSGSKGEYTELDFRDADDVYGRGKALGEIFSENHLTLRTSIIGPELKNNGEGLFHWFMNQSDEINGYTKAFWGGVTTFELSKVLLEAIGQDIKGLSHISNGRKISKYELLLEFALAFKKNLKINPYEGKVVDKSLRSIRNDFKFIVPSYKKMVSEMKEFIYQHSYLYKNYDL